MAEKVILRLTCGACTEQYDAYIGDEQVGYLRLRQGAFRVYCPSSGGETVYVAYPRGDVCFEYDERDGYLRHAVKEILYWRARKIEVSDVDYEILDGEESV